jgi:hypothetical protein
VPVSRIDKMLRRKRREWSKRQRKRPVQGVFNSEAITVLERLGCKLEKLVIVEPTLGRFADDTAAFGAPCLVNVINHYVVTYQGKWNDTTGSNKRVQQAWKVTAPAQPKYTSGIVHRLRKPKEKRDLRAERYGNVLAKIKRWESKLKRANTELKKLLRQKRYYEQQGAQDDQRATRRHRAKRSTGSRMTSPALVVSIE